MGKFTDPTVCRVRNVPRGDTDGYVYIYTRSIRGHARGKREEEEEERDWRRNKKEKERKKKKRKGKKKEGISETRTHPSHGRHAVRERMMNQASDVVSQKRETQLATVREMHY